MYSSSVSLPHQRKATVRKYIFPPRPSTSPPSKRLPQCARVMVETKKNKSVSSVGSVGERYKPVVETLPQIPQMTQIFFKQHLITCIQAKINLCKSVLSVGDISRRLGVDSFDSRDWLSLRPPNVVSCSKKSVLSVKSVGDFLRRLGVDSFDSSDSCSPKKNHKFLTKNSMYSSFTLEISPLS